MSGLRVDEGMATDKPNSTAYWDPDNTVPSSSWWDSTNWFRVGSTKSSDSSKSCENKSKVMPSPATSPPPIELGKESERPCLIETVGGASCFNRFTTTKKEPVEPSTQTRKRKRIDEGLLLESLQGYPAAAVKQVQELIVLPLLHPTVFSSVGVTAPKGIILSGASGTGKSMLIESLVNEMKVYFQKVNCSEILADMSAAKPKPGGGEKKKADDPISKVFEVSIKNEPAILFLDEFEMVARDYVSNESGLMTKLRGVLRTEIDRIVEKNYNVIVIGATSKADCLHPALLRSRRFDRQIILSKPDEAKRLELLTRMTKDMALADDVDLQVVAEQTLGFVASDIDSLCTEAGLNCIRKMLYKRRPDDHDDNDHQPSFPLLPKVLDMNIIENMKVTQANFEAALRTVRPSGLQDIQVDVPDTKWEDIGGEKKLKRVLKETVEFPLKYPHLYRQYSVGAASGLLLYGPPGCGKTMLAKAIATECQASFISVKGPELLTPYMGEAEQRVRELFARARANSPCVIFFDEIDSLTQARGSMSSGADSGAADRVLTQILTEIDQRGIGRANPPNTSASNGPNRKGNSAEEEVMKELVFVIGATNRPDSISPALLRPGRMDQLLYVGLPKKQSRQAILKATLRNTPCGKDVNDQYLADVALRTRGFSGADLASITNRARLLAIRQEIGKLRRQEEEQSSSATSSSLSSSSDTKAADASDTQNEDFEVEGKVLHKSHIEKALKTVSPSVSAETVQKLNQFHNTLVRSRPSNDSTTISPPYPSSSSSSSVADDSKSNPPSASAPKIQDSKSEAQKLEISYNPSSNNLSGGELRQFDAEQSDLIRRLAASLQRGKHVSE